MRFTLQLVSFFFCLFLYSVGTERLTTLVWGGSNLVNTVTTRGFVIILSISTVFNVSDSNTVFKKTTSKKNVTKSFLKVF